ncbi:transmembrane protein 183A isoform X1 [Sphaerodactylus townsendi]|uniref:transmembrane protein 183A isoform X1 n=1 Tax=Sphaerodactylus townsendi TaxID=933632 RepID=UPI00202758C3|nr:transmembrane protein 183A isoform X1 [Sphaerodactylus townsendi]
MAPRDRPVAAPPFAMRKRGARKRLKFRGDDVCSQRVTVADYANSDPAVVKSGRMKKAVANAVQQEVKSLCGLEASFVPTDEVLSATESCASSDEMDCKEFISDRILSRKKKSKRHKENADGAVGQEYPIDIWLVLASYIRPEDIVNFSLICKRAWTAICTAAFWTRLYRRHYNRTAPLPIRLQPESMEKMYCLRACVIRSLYHMYRPFASRVARNPAIPETTPSTLKNSKCLLFWSKRVDKPSSLWEFSFKFKRLSPKFKNSHLKLQPPVRYEDVHLNPDQDCCVLQITTLDFIYIPIVMGMSVTLFTINVSTDMRHHRVKMVFHDSPVWNGKKPRFDHGVQVIMDPVHSVRLFDWWHPQFPSSHI